MSTWDEIVNRYRESIQSGQVVSGRNDPYGPPKCRHIYPAPYGSVALGATKCTKCGKYAEASDWNGQAMDESNPMIYLPKDEMDKFNNDLECN